MNGSIKNAADVRTVLPAGEGSARRSWRAARREKGRLSGPPGIPAEHGTQTIINRAYSGSTI
ncbi:hypothetical protein M8494_21730 [Serratia ureilytica]